MMLAVLLCEARHLLVEKITCSPMSEWMNRTEKLIGSLRVQLTGEAHSLVSRVTVLVG